MYQWFSETESQLPWQCLVWQSSSTASVHPVTGRCTCGRRQADLKSWCHCRHCQSPPNCQNVTLHCHQTRDRCRRHYDDRRRHYDDCRDYDCCVPTASHRWHQPQSVSQSNLQSAKNHRENCDASEDWQYVESRMNTYRTSLFRHFLEMVAWQLNHHIQTHGTTHRQRSLTAVVTLEDMYLTRRHVFAPPTTYTVPLVLILLQL